MTLSDLPERWRTREWIEGAIRYEEYPGLHTYHCCPCGRGQCRSRCCGACWRNVLAELVEKEASDERD